MEKKKIILKSAHPEQYPDLEIECKVIPREKIGEYLETIPEERKFYAHKKGVVSARVGTPGEEIVTTLLVVVDGREYIFSEEKNSVRETEVDGTKKSDVVVTNLESNSKEQYIVRRKKFEETYTPEEDLSKKTGMAVFAPVPESRLLAQVDENVIIITSWGAEAVCLKGSYIVTYDAETDSYNTLEQGAFKSTYVIETTQDKKKAKNNKVKNKVI